MTSRFRSIHIAYGCGRDSESDEAGGLSADSRSGRLQLPESAEDQGDRLRLTRGHGKVFAGGSDFGDESSPRGSRTRWGAPSRHRIAAVPPTQGCCLWVSWLVSSSRCWSGAHRMHSRSVFWNSFRRRTILAPRSPCHFLRTSRRSPLILRPSRHPVPRRRLFSLPAPLSLP